MTSTIPKASERGTCFAVSLEIESGPPGNTHYAQAFTFAFGPGIRQATAKRRGQHGSDRPDGQYHTQCADSRAMQLASNKALDEE